jgi:hypothetical protein
MFEWNRWILLAILSGLSLFACGDSTGDRSPDGPAPDPGAQQDDAAPNVAETVTPQREDPRIAELLRRDPDAPALRYLSRTLLFTESEAEFLSAMRTLSRSRSPLVAALAAETLSTGYHVATSEGFDIGGAIETILKSRSPHLRRITVFHLGRFEAPEIRRWLQDRLEDAEVDETWGNGRTVADQARAALARLDEAKEKELSISPHDALAVTVATVGTPLRAPIRGGACELLIEIESVTSRADSSSRLRQPYVDATFTIVVRGTDFRVAVMNARSASMYAGRFMRTANALLFVYCRPVAKDRVRCWYRAEVETEEK